MDRLVITATVAVAFVGLWIAWRPTSAVAVEAFERRYGSADPAAATYLRVTRRLRALAVTAVLCYELLARLDEERVEVNSVAIAGAWMIGALAAEQRLRTLSRPAVSGTVPHRVPPMLTWTLAAVAAIGALVTGAVVVAARLYVPPGDVVPWGFASVAVALTALAAVHLIARRPGPDWSPELDAAAARRSMHGIAAGGVLTALLCLAQTVDAAREGLFGATEDAVTGVSQLWTVAGVVVALAIVVAGRDPHRRTTFVAVPVVAAVALVASAIWLGYGLRRDRPPYPATAIDARVTLAFADAEHVESVTAALAGDHLQPLLPFDDGQTIVGRLDYDVPPGATGTGTYHVVLIDDGNNAVAPPMFGVNGGGWGGFLYRVPRQHPWLSALGDIHGDPMAIGVSPNEPGPVFFSAQFPDRHGLSVERLTVAIIFTGPDNQVYWTLDVPIREF